MADQQQQEQQQQAPHPGTQTVLHPTLVPELLGFSPQMLLDDIISAAADAILQCLQAMEPFMQRWADARVQKAAGANSTNGNGNGNDAEGARKRGADERDAEWDGLEAVEQGLVAFQTLLESHTDIAFDFFEAWSLRNIFTLAPDLPVVAPHQRGLDLRTRPEEETALMTDIEDLRRRIENQRRLKSTYLKALRISRIGRARTERRLSRLAYLSPTSLTTPNALAALTSLPPAVHELFESAAALPHAAGLAAGAPALADASRRQWETGRTGYVNWAVGQLVARSKQMGTPAAGGSTAVSNAAAHIAGVGDVRDVKALADVVEVEEEHERDSLSDMDTS